MTGGRHSETTVRRPQLLFTDLDGTLIVGSDDLKHEASRLIGLARATGGSVVPVSARPVGNIARMFRGHKDIFVIASGGGVIGKISDGRIIEIVHEETFEPDSAIHLMSAMLMLQAEVAGALFTFQDSTHEFEVIVSGDSTELGSAALRTIIGNRPVRHADYHTMSREYQSRCLLGVSFLARTTSEGLRRLIPLELMSPRWRFAIYPEVRIPGWSWCEAFPVAAEKGQACCRVLDLWIAKAEITPLATAAGDSADDVAMFTMVNQSCCPSTASDEVQGAVTMVLPVPGGEPFARAMAEWLGLTGSSCH